MFTEDLTPFFSTDDFAVDAVWTPAAGGGPFTIQVIFDHAYREFSLGEAGQAGREPECLAIDAQIAQGSGMKRGDSLLVNGTTYKVDTVEPDGTDVSRIELRT